MHSLQEWLRLDDREIAQQVAPKASTAVVYLNGTRRWFLSQNKNWADYAKITGVAHRKLSQMFYDHGIRTLIQPLLGYDLLDRGADYIKMAIEQGLIELAKGDYRNWYHQAEIRVTLYGNWTNALAELGFDDVIELLRMLAETTRYTKHRLLLGVFADEGLDNITKLARTVHQGEELLQRYYGQPVGPVDLVIGSGQPAIWDLPLLDINKASLYFIQAPTFFLDKGTLRRILYDHIYQRINDDELYENLTPQEWGEFEVLGLGQQSQKGWIAK